MVATVLRIRFRILANTLLRNPWQLVGVIFGALGALGLLTTLGAVLFLSGGLGVQAATGVVVVLGALLTLGWTLGPLLVAGVDTTLDPVKLAPFPMTTSRMMVALTLAGATGIPGLAALLGGLTTFAVWARWPVSLPAAIVCVPLGIAICVVASRLIATLATGFGGRRRTREIIGGATFLLVVAAGPVSIGLTQLARSAAEAGDRLAGFVSALSWTPIAAAWAAPGDFAAGSPLTGAAKALIALGTLAVLWVLWQRGLVASLGAPRTRAAASVRAGKIGWFGRLPTGPLGATWARSLTSWLRDPRYLRQLLTVPLVPVLIIFYTFYSGNGITEWTFLWSAVGVAFVLGIAPYTDVSYDGTGFASVLQTGIRGRDDRLGRMLGAATVGIPAVLVITAAAVAISGAWSHLPAVLGGAIGLLLTSYGVCAVGLLLTSYGVCAVSSAILVVPVPASGDNPFKRVPGTTFVMGLAFLGFWIAAGILAGPVLVLTIVSVATASALLGWIALAVGVVGGLVVLAVGVIVGGRIFDRTAPSLLLTLSGFSGL